MRSWRQPSFLCSAVIYLMNTASISRNRRPAVACSTLSLIVKANARLNRTTRMSTPFQVGDAMGEGVGLARTRSRNDEQWCRGQSSRGAMLDRTPLFGLESFEVRGC